MKLIVGLGNPGQKYQKTRHNLGFMVMDFFAGNKGLSWQYNLDLPFGKIRLTYGSSSAGHRGIESIIENLGMEFTKLRIGIGRPSESIDPEKYVLQKFSTKENTQLPNIIAKRVAAIKSYLESGIEAAMNR